MNPTARILIIDDEPVARKAAQSLLLKEHYLVDSAVDGPEGLAKLATFEPDTILLDVMMPGMDGYEVCRRIKADPRFQAIPVIMLTALSDKQNLVRGLEAGADEFLTKPIGGLELRARVQTMLRLKRQHDRLLATMRLREDLANMVAHDMRNPLGAILGYAELLLTVPELEAKPARYASEVRRCALRLKHFIEDFLMQAKMEEGRFVLHRTEVALGPLLERVRENHLLMAQSRQVGLRFEVAAGAPRTVQVDATLCERLLDNLLSNAIKYSPPGQSIVVTAEPGSKPEAISGGQVRLRFADQGPGIAAEHRKRIFDKFEIVELKKANTEQIGLGLAFCKLVTDAHTGRIHVEPNSPCGSVFVVEL